MSNQFLLFITYFISTEDDLRAAHKAYLERIEAARQITDVLFVSDEIRKERRLDIYENLMADLRRDMQAIGHYPFDESAWNLYSLSCIARDVDEPADEGATVSRLWADLRLAEETIPRTFTSSVSGILFSPDGRGSSLGEVDFT